MTFIAQNKIVNELHFMDEMKLLFIFLWVNFLLSLDFTNFHEWTSIP
jgi:hypothetical protein